MLYLESFFYWASAGCPDAVPAGIIAVDLGLNDANQNEVEIKEIHDFLCEECFFDDASWQLGFTQDDVDLIRREEGNGASYLTSSQLVPDWQWQLIKAQPGLRISAHNLEQHFEEMEKFMQEEQEQ